MPPVARVLAVCTGGPEDGRRFSVPCDDDGNPQSLVVDGVIYDSQTELELKDNHRRSIDVQQQINDGQASELDKHEVFQGFELFIPNPDGAVRGHDFAAVYLYGVRDGQ